MSPESKQDADGKARGAGVSAPSDSGATVDLPKGLILGAGGEAREATKGAPVPRSLIEDPFGARALDWILASYRCAGIEEITFVGGYRIEEVGQSFPALNFIYNPDWDEGGVLSSLYHAREKLQGGVLISYGDVVYREDVCKKLIDQAMGGMAVAVDTTFRPTLSEQGRVQKNLAILQDGTLDEIGFLSVSPKTNATFVGLVYLAPEASAFIHEFLEGTYPSLIGKPFEQAQDIQRAYMTDLIRYCQRKDFPVQAVDIGANWAEMDEPGSLARFVMGTKSETLARLAGMIKKGRFCEQLVFCVGDWKQARGRLTQAICDQFSPHPIVVRSSALAEDSWQESMAGAFQSVLNVDSQNPDAIADAMDAVVESYGKSAEAVSDDNQILIQRMVQNVVMHGVVFTREIQHNAPYYVINYDDESQETDTVTSGAGDALKTVIVSRTYDGPMPSPRLAALRDVVQELESITGCSILDIEFAVDEGEDIYVLQVRPLAAVDALDAASDADVAAAVEREQSFFSRLAAPAPHLFGRTTFLGDMPDWNPAEMIGPRPRPLAFSLYQHLITDKAWRIARGQIGYNNPAGVRLMLNVAGHPYIDVRASFNNLIPADLPAPLAEKVIDIYLNRLQAHPDRHDKVEFEVCVTCLDFTFDSNAEELTREGMSSSEVRSFRDALRTLTDRIVCEKDRPMSSLISELERLGQRRKHFLAQSTSGEDIPRLIDCLLDDCISYGIIPFSILARYAFVANSLLKSLVTRGALSPEALAEFLNQIETVATELVRDMDAVAANRLSQDLFLSRYGHLRPGTYDITSLRYDEAPDVYFALERTPPVSADTPTPERAAAWSPDVLGNVQSLIDEAGFSFQASPLFDFCRRAISLREYGKFEFTKTVSEVLRLVGLMGEREGFSREELSFLDIQDLLTMGVNRPSGSIREWLGDRMAHNRKWSSRSDQIHLPHLILKPADFDVMRLEVSRPNFVTSQKVSGSVTEVLPASGSLNLEGKIVLIESADPGYDWIFSHQIAGLITRYGGAASHMTIRASEFNVPAAIGCGEVLYQRVRRAQFVELDCMGKHVRTS